MDSKCLLCQSVYQNDSHIINNGRSSDDDENNTENSDEKRETPLTERGKILIMDKDTGIEQESTQWSHGLHQFIQLKHTSKLSNESLKPVFISNYNYF